MTPALSARRRCLIDRPRPGTALGSPPVMQPAASRLLSIPSSEATHSPSAGAPADRPGNILAACQRRQPIDVPRPNIHVQTKSRPPGAPHPGQRLLPIEPGSPHHHHPMPTPEPRRRFVNLSFNRIQPPLCPARAVTRVTPFLPAGRLASRTSCRVIIVHLRHWPAGRSEAY